MTFPRSLALATALVLLAAPARLLAVPAQGASAAVESSNRKLRQSLRAFYKSSGAKREQARREARAAVGSLLDFDAFARATLGKHWDGLKPAERARYAEAMRGAMEANYLAKMQSGNVDVDQVKSEVLGEEKQGGNTLVKTKVHSGSDVVEVDYLMETSRKGPRAVDVVTEGVSLVETYRDQINTLFPKKGLQGVIDAFERVRKRAEKQQNEQADRQNGSAGTPGSSAPDAAANKSP